MHSVSDSMDETVKADVTAWLNDVVIGHNLCPFAKREQQLNRIRLVVCRAGEPQALIDALQAELELMVADSDVETTLIAHPWVLQDFDDYNQFLDLADALLELMHVDGTFQIASFHPDYRFDGTDDNDPSNYTNRSPYPLLHILREASVARAVEQYGDSALISKHNVEHLVALGIDEVRALVVTSTGDD